MSKFQPIFLELRRHRLKFAFAAQQQRLLDNHSHWTTLVERRKKVFLLTLAITWPQGVLSEEVSLAVAAQVHGGVS